MACLDANLFYWRLREPRTKFPMHAAALLIACRVGIFALHMLTLPPGTGSDAPRYGGTRAFGRATSTRRVTSFADVQYVPDETALASGERQAPATAGEAMPWAMGNALHRIMFAPLVHPLAAA